MTFIYKYLFTPFLAAGFLFAIITTWKLGNQFSQDWSRGSAVILCWAMIWLFIMMFRLKSVEGNKDYLKVKTLQSEKIVQYRDIVWISQLALISPVLISVKYFDGETGRHRKILIMPDLSSQIFRFNFLSELELTRQLRERIMESNPSYSKAKEPSRWLPIILILLTGLPAVLIINYFFMHLN